MFGLAILFTVGAALFASFMAPMAYTFGRYDYMILYMLPVAAGVGLLIFIPWLAKRKPHWKFL